MNKLHARIGFRIKRHMKQSLCSHQWQERLIFCGNPNTHRDIKSCCKCHKSETVFSGTRREYFEYHGWDM